jgi:chemotaxis protein histidine kinase CheA/ActR/RegA family two-component response regulator
LQYLVEGTRMLPLSTLSARLERNVRQTCRATGKTVSLEIRGDDIRVDRDVLNRLAEPLMHVLRNAVDHGIEAAEERIGQGKPAAGRLVLQFQRLGQAVEVRCIDDGRGYDFERIRVKAVSLGLIDAGHLPNEDELARLTMMPGFSTSAAVTEVSGRGIGMDIVLSRMQAMHGSVAVTSVRGAGTEVCLRFQGSLVTQHVLLVRVDAAIMAIPSHQVEFALPAGNGSVQSADGTRRWRYLDRSLDHYFLADLAGLAAADAAEIEHKPALVIRRINGAVALSVDELVDSHQSVVKDMGMYLSGMHGVLGAIMRADGAVVPLLDIAALLDKPSDRVHRAIEAARGPARTTVLVVDDSPTVRQSLALLLNDAGYAVTTARDGMDAIALAAKVKPDIVLTDLEMPVLDGLELTQHLRARPETHALPIVMITSRSMEKHRRLAEQAGVSAYVTKPYTDQELLAVVARLLASGATSSAVETTAPMAAG